MSEAAQRKEKPKWNLDSARRLRWIYFIDPADAEFKVTIKSARRKLEVPMPAAAPCKTQGGKCSETCRTSGIRKTKYACLVEADESARKRLEGALHQDHLDHKAGKGINSLTRNNLVHKFIPLPKAMKIQDAKAAVDKRMGGTRENTGMAADESQMQKKEVIAEARREGQTVQFASLMYLCHLRNLELEPRYQKCKGRVVLRGDNVKDDSGSYSVFTEQGVHLLQK